MRGSWERSDRPVEISAVDLDRMVRSAFPGQTVLESRLVPGGLANTNYRLVLSARDRPIRLKIYNRGPQAAVLERAVASALPAAVPTPRHLHLDLAGPAPYAFLEWVDGMPLEAAFSGMAVSELEAIGRQLGAALAAIHRRRFARTGYLDANLEVVQPFDANAAGLLAYARTVLFESPASSRIEPRDRDRLWQWLQSASRLLDAVDAPACLNHGDCGASNVLVAKRGARTELCGIVDWEYACAGIRLFDVASLLRPPLGDVVPFSEAFAGGYLAAGGFLPNDWKRMMRVADMFARLEMLSRPALHESTFASVWTSVEMTISELGVPG
jgi:aminoglycoside phosphotransferase (APT) family kinase protein